MNKCNINMIYDENGKPKQKPIGIMYSKSYKEKLPNWWKEGKKNIHIQIIEGSKGILVVHNYAFGVWRAEFFSDDPEAIKCWKRDIELLDGKFI